MFVWQTMAVAVICGSGHGACAEPHERSDTGVEMRRDTSRQKANRQRQSARKGGVTICKF